MLCITACGTTPKVVTKTKVKPVIPPQQWIEKIEHPKLQGKTNEDLWKYAEEQNKVLDLYNIRLKKLRQWRKENKEDFQE